MSFLEEYNYSIPEELVAHEPASPRDSARLFVYDTKTNAVSFHTVRDLSVLLPGAQFIYNNTRVEPARLKGIGNANKPVELLVLVDQGFGEHGEVRSLVNRFTPIGEAIHVDGYIFSILENNEKSMLMQFSGSRTELSQLLETSGETPLPPYIHSTESEEVKRTRYQTIFAEDAASIAAPTASLHFTRELIESLHTTGAHLAPVTLQVGLGTFAPIFPEHFESGKLHTEFCSVPEGTAKAILQARDAGKPVVAIGTTVMRTLESFKDEIKAGTGAFGSTEIFIRPPYSFTHADALLTNFHVPKSSLMCLVEAFLQSKGAKKHSLVDLYNIAILEKFRFYSFGDAMLIL